MMTQLIAYLHFSGQCREALTFYQQCLGGELNMQKFGESAMGAQMPSNADANILRGSLTKDGVTIVMGSDLMGARLKQGNSIALCLHCTSNEELNKCFDRLSSGGLVVMPPHQSIWGGIYGELTDRYGIKWMLNYTKN
jgi:PhnB protein